MVEPGFIISIPLHPAASLESAFALVNKKLSEFDTTNHIARFSSNGSLVLKVDGHLVKALSYTFYDYRPRRAKE